MSNEKAGVRTCERCGTRVFEEGDVLCPNCGLYMRQYTQPQGSISTASELPDQTAVSDQGIRNQPTEMKKCPYCAEEIKAEAILCKHCGSSLGGADKGEERSKVERWAADQVPSDEKMPVYCVLSIVIGLVMVFLGIMPGFGIFLLVFGFAGLLFAIATRK